MRTSTALTEKRLAARSIKEIVDGCTGTAIEPIVALT
jgi:hypothetical protein